MQGANLSFAEMQGAKFLSTATLRGAVLRILDCTTIADLKDHVAECFGDGSVTLPDDWEWPAKWPRHELEIFEFVEELRKWQADPEKYEPPASPEDEDQ